MKMSRKRKMIDYFFSKPDMPIRKPTWGLIIVDEIGVNNSLNFLTRCNQPIIVRAMQNIHVIISMADMFLFVDPPFLFVISS